MRTKLAIFCEKVIEAGWLAAVVSVPLFFNIYTARTFEPDKITLLRSIVSVMVLAWIIMLVEQGLNTSEDKPPAQHLRNWLKQPLFVPTLLLVVVYIVSTIFSISPRVSLWGSYQRLQGTYSALSYIVVFALMAANLHTREQVDRLVTTVIITSVPVGLYGIVQRYGLDPLPWAGNVTARVASNMGNAIFVASYLIMVVPLTLVRLIESMAAIIKEREASWGHTILAAVYIFVLAVQILTILFSGSRGPMLGVLGAGFIMGLLITLILRQLHANSDSLSVKEIGLGLTFAIPLVIAGGIGGGAGYFVGAGLQNLLSNYQVDNLPLLGAALGGLLGFFGLYTAMAASKKGWRWLWISWLSVAALAIGFVLALNVRGTALDPYLDPIRQTPYVSRLGQITTAESGSGKVRVLIWDAVVELLSPHQPLGIAGDNLAGQDNFNAIRPLIGYGPESMFNAFAYVYPPDLAHVEARGSSADRSHNETMDSLVITGILGFLAFYGVMVGLFYYMLVWLGWTPDKAAKQRLLALLILGGIIGAVVSYLADGDLTFVALGLPFGLVAGSVIHLLWQGIAAQQEVEPGDYFTTDTLLLIGLLGAIVGHFIEVHFVFSIAATYIYFWAYAGLIVALAKIKNSGLVASDETALPEDTSQAEQPVTEPVAQNKRSKRRRGRRGAKRAGGGGPRPPLPAGRENWETWLGGQSLAMAIILIILTFDFITPQFEFSLADENSRVFFWMLLITWFVGFAIVMSNLAVRLNRWWHHVSWGRALLLYSITSFSYFLFYTMAHRIQLGQRVAVNTVEDAIRAANVLANALLIFYIFLFLLMVILAITLSWRRTKGLPFWRSENWWLYPPLIIAIVAVIWAKNLNVVWADTYLKEGNRYRSSQQWNHAIALHEKARSLDSDEDFYYLMLALDYQLMAQDGRLDQAQRQNAWQRGEEIALQAREINPYNPDNTGNMGRYYFTLGQIFDPEYFQNALNFFEKATTLAPSNVIYHNLWAQTHYILQNYQKAIDRLQTSVAIDPNYAPTWILLGDTHAATGNVDKALMAHSEAIKLNSRGSGDGFASFADQFLDQRLNFYISAGRGQDIVAAMQQVLQERPDEARVHWAIGHAYNLMGEPDKALPYFEQARDLGDNSNRTLKELANIYLSSDAPEQALSVYQTLAANNPNDVETQSALAYIYAQQGRLDEAIQHNHAVLQQIPNDYDSLKNLAILYQQTGQLQEALTFAQKAQAAASEAEQPSWNQFIANLESQLATNN